MNILSLIAFPFIVVAVSMVGFVCGVPITRWHFPLACLLTCIFIWFTSESDNRKRDIWRFFTILVISIALVSIPVMYTVTDGANCHRPATFLLANGWNPIYQSEFSQVEELANSFFSTKSFGLKLSHITYVPRATWIFGAVLYKIFGYVEIVDALNAYLLIVTFFYLKSWIKRFLCVGKVACIAFAVLLCVNPHAVIDICDGCLDPAVCLLLACGLFALDAYCRDHNNRDFGIAILAFPLACGVKFTGVTMAILAPLVYAIFMPDRRKLFLGFLAIVGLIFALNATPYVTSWINHGGPFYPAHTFSSSEKLPDKMTGDFDMKNDDAKQMGYWGRFAYAYVSKALTKEYYRRKLDKDKFEPQLMMFEDVDGFGTVYCVYFIFSLLLLFLVKDKGLKMMALLLVATIFLQPGKYMGYGRYVASIYLLPLIVSFGVLMRWRENSGRLCKWILPAMTLYSIAVMPKAGIMHYPYMWLMSVQNLQMAMGMMHERAPVIATDFYYCAHALKHDVNESAIIVPRRGIKTTKKRFSYGLCSEKYFYLTDNEIPDFRGYTCKKTTASMILDKSFSSVRHQGIEKYFIKEFLPKEIIMLPKRFWQTARLRANQIARVWQQGNKEPK